MIFGFLDGEASGVILNENYQDRKGHKLHTYIRSDISLVHKNDNLPENRKVPSFLISRISEMFHRYFRNFDASLSQANPGATLK